MPDILREVQTGFQSTGQPYSQANMLGAMKQPMGAPDYSDPLRLRTQIMDDVGLTDAKNRVIGLKGSVQKYADTTRARGLDLSNNQVSLNKIVGRQRTDVEARQGGAIDLDRQYQSAVDLYSAKNDEYNTRFGIAMNQRGDMQQLMVKYPGAGIKWTDNWEEAVKAGAKWQKKEDRKAEKRAEKSRRKAEKRAEKRAIRSYNRTHSKKSAGKGKGTSGDDWDLTGDDFEFSEGVQAVLDANDRMNNFKNKLNSPVKSTKKEEETKGGRVSQLWHRFIGK